MNDTILIALISAIFTGIWFLYFREFQAWRQIQLENDRIILSVRNGLLAYLIKIDRNFELLKENRGPDFRFAIDLPNEIYKLYSLTDFNVSSVEHSERIITNIESLFALWCFSIDDTIQYKIAIQAKKDIETLVNVLDEVIKNKETLSFNAFMADWHPEISRVRDLIHDWISTPFDYIRRVFHR